MSASRSPSPTRCGSGPGASPALLGTVSSAVPNHSGLPVRVRRSTSLSRGHATTQDRAGPQLSPGRCFGEGRQSSPNPRISYAKGSIPVGGCSGGCGCGQRSHRLTGNPGNASAQSGAAPDASTGSATDVTEQTVKLNGTVNPNGTATSYTFEYGPSASYGSQSTPASAGSGISASNVSATLAGLAPGATYHYRLTATNSNGQTASGVDRTFTTQARGSSLGLFGHTAFVGPGRQVGVFTGCLG